MFWWLMIHSVPVPLHCMVFNSSYAASHCAPYGVEHILGFFTCKTPASWSVVGL